MALSGGTRRVRFLLPGALVLAVLFDGGCGASSSSTAPGTASANPSAASPAGLAVAASPTVVTHPPRSATPSAHKPTTRPSPSGSASSSSSRPPTAGPATTHPAVPATTSSRSAPSATPASSTTAQNAAAVAQVLGLIN